MMKIATHALLAAGLLAGLFSGVAMAAKPRIPATNEPRPSNIQIVEMEWGFVFADAQGKTLYAGLFDPKPNVSTCMNVVKPFPKFTGSIEDGNGRMLPITENMATCTTKHPPAQVGDAKPVGPWTVINRPDGIKQWAYKGKPVYTSIKDRFPGEINAGNSFKSANNFLNVLYAPLDIPPDVKIATIGMARVFTTPNNRTLYTSTLDPIGKSVCEGACLKTWRPLLGGAVSQPRGDWTLITRSDKTRQWAFQGKPLYTYIDDLEADDVNGNGRPNFEVALAWPIPETPSLLSVRNTPIGLRYADAAGKTIYYYTCNGELECDDPGDKSLWWWITCGGWEKCADIWKPIAVPPGTKLNGHFWSVVDLPLPWQPVRAKDGSTEPSIKVLAYKGWPVFTYKYDDHPGMIDGDDIGVLGTMRWTSIVAVGTDLNKGPMVQVLSGRTARASR